MPVIVFVFGWFHGFLGPSCYGALMGSFVLCGFGGFHELCLFLVWGSLFSVHFLRPFCINKITI